MLSANDKMSRIFCFLLIMSGAAGMYNAFGFWPASAAFFLTMSVCQSVFVLANALQAGRTHEDPQDKPESGK